MDEIAFFWHRIIPFILDNQIPYDINDDFSPTINELTNHKHSVMMWNVNISFTLIIGKLTCHNNVHFNNNNNTIFIQHSFHTIHTFKSVLHLNHFIYWQTHMLKKWTVNVISKFRKIRLILTCACTTKPRWNWRQPIRSKI